MECRPMHHDEPLRELVRRIVDNDDAAAQRLVHLYEPALRRYIRLHLTDPRLRQLLDSTDVSQSVFGEFFTLAANGKLNLDEPGQLVKLLATMARRKLLNRARDQHAGRRDTRRLQEDGWEALKFVPDHRASPSETASDREVLHELHQRLAPEDLDLAHQWAMGRAWSDIASGQGTSPEAARKRLARALQRVARDLGVEESPT